MVNSSGGLGVKAAKPPEPPSLLDSSKHNCNTIPAEEPRSSPAVYQGLTGSARDVALTQETRRARRGRNCGKWTMRGDVDGKFKYQRHRCKSWACRRCGRLKLRVVRARIADYAAQHKLQRLVTLTLDPKKLPPGLSQKKKVQYLRQCWRGMRVYLRRKLGRSAAFISVLEFQQNGNPHLHVLVDTYLPKDWLLGSWQALGGGYTDVRFVDLHRVALYLSKYMTKEWLEEFPEGCRRITASHGLVFFSRGTGQASWRLYRQPLSWFRREAELRHAEIESEEYSEVDGARELVQFVSDAMIAWEEHTLTVTNQWREEEYLRRGDRRTIRARIAFSHERSVLELQPEKVVYTR
jgi:hypothetical protein